MINGDQSRHHGTVTVGDVMTVITVRWHMCHQWSTHDKTILSEHRDPTGIHSITPLLEFKEGTIAYRITCIAH